MSDIPGKPGHLPEKRQSVGPPRHLVLGAALVLALLLVVFAVVFFSSHNKPVCPVKAAGNQQKVDKTCR